MTTPLLATKLYIPPLRHDLVARERLIEQLNAGLTNKLTLISAPAGFGKTTLVCSWIKQVGQDVAWLSLDEEDNDPTRFLSYFIAALQTIDSDFEQGVSATLQSPGAVNIEAVLTTLLNELTDYPGEIVFVLDDYHAIESQTIHQALTYFLDYLPGNMHLVIATRVDPPLPLARLRARDQMIELRTPKLRFNNAEAAAFLNRVMDLNLSADEITALETRTEGWIVGLQLAALSLQEREDIQDFIKSFTGSHHHILDYLLEEVLSQQSLDTQSFLMQTSILKRLTGPLCGAVCIYGSEDSDRSDGQETLERLAKSNLFIVPLDDERQWYRYHHLFADLLQARLIRFHPHRLINLHLRASAWFADNGLLAEAVEHAFLAEDYDRAADLIEQAASGKMLYGRPTTILGWLDALPKDILNTRLRLGIYQAWSLAIAGQPIVADKILLDAKSTLETLPRSPENLILRGELAALRTGIIIYHNAPNEIIQEAEEALNYLPEENIVSRARVYMALGTAYAYSNKMQKATKTYEQGRDLALKANAPFLATANIELLTELLVYYEGRLKDAAQNLRQILEMGITKDGNYEVFTGAAHILMAEINLEWNNLEATSHYLEKGFELLKQGGIGYTLTHCYCAAARIKLAFGETDSAIEYLQSATQATQASPLMHFQIRNLACQVNLALYLGDTKTAHQWAAGENCELPDILPHHLQEVQQISLARVYFAQGDLTKTIETLDRILPQAKSASRLAHVIDIYLLKARALQESGKATSSLKCLESALSIAAPEGYIQTFVEHGEPMARMIEEVAELGIEPTYISRLLSAFDNPYQFDAPISAVQTVEPKRDGRATSIIPPLKEPLTDRELEVLRLMTDGLTYNEIAAQIMVSVNTVRSHVKNIYSKLYVHKRSQAIARARELNIL